MARSSPLGGFWPERGRELFDKLAGILLTAIAFTLLASGVTRLVTDVLHDVKVLLSLPTAARKPSAWNEA